MHAYTAHLRQLADDFVVKVTCVIAHMEESMYDADCDWRKEIGDFAQAYSDLKLKMEPFLEMDEELDVTEDAKLESEGSQAQ